jgi:hypothetical protein
VEPSIRTNRTLIFTYLMHEHTITVLSLLVKLINPNTAK